MYAMLYTVAIMSLVQPYHTGHRQSRRHDDGVKIYCAMKQNCYIISLPSDVGLATRY